MRGDLDDGVLARSQRDYAIRRDRTQRRAADLRTVEHALDRAETGHTLFRRGREYRFVDEYAQRVVGLLRQPLTRRTLIDAACAAMRDAGYRCARLTKHGRWTRAALRKGARLVSDPRVQQSLKDAFTDVGLDGRQVAQRLKTIINDGEAEDSLKAIDIYAKVTGDYAPTRVDQRNLNANVPVNIFAGGAAFMDRVGKPDVSAALGAPIDTPFTPIFEEKDHARTSATER